MFDTVGFSLTSRNKTVYWEDLSRQMLVSILNGGDNWFQHPFITNIAKHRLRVCICSSSGDCAEVEVVFLINMSPLHSLMILGSCHPSPLSPGNTAAWQNEEVSKPQLQKFFFKRIFILFMLPFAILHRLNTCEKAENRKQTI